MTALGAAFCAVWLLTTPCDDDRLQWTPNDTLWTRIVYGGNTVTLEPGAASYPLGCWEGTVRVTHLDASWRESTPVFVEWDADPQRMMDIDCVNGSCEQPVCWDEP